MKTACAIVLFVLASRVHAQTYKIGPDASQKPQTQPDQTQTSGQQLGWGSNIQNARLARAAQMALAKGDHAQALEYAQRAAQAAPNDAQLWFLLGYAARLDGKFQQAVDAYSRGLRLTPSSLEGMSGLAQTYSVTGRTDDAERLLKQVVAADPRRSDDAVLLGDLYMRSGDYTTAVDWLGRGERVHPAARSELLLAISYQHLKQMDAASRYLNMAKHRDPNNPEVERSLGAYYRETGDYGQAIAALRSIHNPRPDVVAELAYTYQLDGKLEDSAGLYAQAANAMPKDIGLQLSAAQAQVAVGAIDHANHYLERAAALDPDYYRLHAIRGAIAQMQERDNDAVKEYTAAVAHLPANPAEGPLYGIQLHVDLLELAESLNDAEAAKTQLQIAQTQIGALDERGADRPQFLRLRATIKLHAGQPESALGDMKEALALAPHDPNNLQLDGDLLMKLGRVEEAAAAYQQILNMDPRNRFALTSMGYASRAEGRDQDAERYFKRLAQFYPNLYVPYLALGDLYTSRHAYKRAEEAYSKGYQLAPTNALMVAGAMNAAIEDHDLTLAGTWEARVTDPMLGTPQILREKERYLSFKGDYAQSEAVGEQAIAVLPRDRDVVVYLGYDLLNQQKYDQLLQLTEKYDTILPKEPDIPLLAGYVHKHNNQLNEARQAFTETLQRDPEVVTAYVNLGYVLNDLHDPQEAADNFNEALKREPKNGEAHLGLASSDLNLNRPQGALHNVELARAEMGDSGPIHLIAATAYGRAGMLTKAADEYRAALRFSPNDSSLYFGLGNTLFAERRYHDAIEQLETAQKLTPHDANTEALLARAYGNLGDRANTMTYVQLAESDAPRLRKPEEAEYAHAEMRESNPVSAIYVSTGQALSALGDQKAAMDRFGKALTAPHSDRVSVRLAIAQLMAEQNHDQDAERQIALAVMEAESGETAPVSGEQYIAAADVFRSMHEYSLSEQYLERAEKAGASDISVRVGLANNYLALGNTNRAAAELAAVHQTDDARADYQFLLAQANVYEQEHQGTQALTEFAQAASAAGEDQSAEQSLLQAGANEGYRVTPHVSLLSNYSMEGIFEDTTVYVLDSKLDLPGTTVTVPPRSSLENQETAAFHLHFGKLPSPGGFFQVRNARGEISAFTTGAAATALGPPTINRDTTDYTFNFGLSPSFHAGNTIVTVNGGLQETVRRDSTINAAQLNQNLFRLFAYLSTGSFFNVISANGYVIRETGPFTDIPLHSDAVLGAFDFRVGSPWGRTALVTGWGRNDQTFTPGAATIRGTENYYTESYVGMTHRFSNRLDIEGLVEDLRAWRTVKLNGTTYSALAQALRPAGTVHFELNQNWALQGSSAYSSTRDYHQYDATQNSFSVSYARAFHRKFNADTGEVSLQYPIRISAGLQEESFFNYSDTNPVPNTPHGQNQQFRPYVSITIF